jgi:hypothetical protein
MKRVDLQAYLERLYPDEVRRVFQLGAFQASHCNGMSCGSLAGCAVLCKAMNCPDFAHACSANCQLMGGCPAQIRCSGFTGDGSKCGPFVKV